MPAPTGIGVTLPFRRGNTGMFETSITFVQQTKSNFKNLVLTKKGERIHHPDFGCDIWKVAFEQMTDENLDKARLSIVDAVDRWLPYLELINFQISKNADNDYNKIQIFCSYRFRNNPNVTDSVDFSIL
jgi:phage baseplate assembly protein W